MIQAEVITEWVGLGTPDDPFEARVYRDHKLQRCTDITEQPAANINPNPNLYIVRILCEQIVFNDILLDPNCEVLTSVTL